MAAHMAAHMGVERQTYTQTYIHTNTHTFREKNFRKPGVYPQQAKRASVWFKNRALQPCYTRWNICLACNKCFYNRVKDGIK